MEFKIEIAIETYFQEYGISTLLTLCRNVLRKYIFSSFVNFFHKTFLNKMQMNILLGWKSQLSLTQNASNSNTCLIRVFASCVVKFNFHFIVARIRRKLGICWFPWKQWLKLGKRSSRLIPRERLKLGLLLEATKGRNKVMVVAIAVKKSSKL